jgi:hypothetical protein
LLGLGFDQPFRIHLAKSLIRDIRAHTIATKSKYSGEVVHFLAVTNFREDSSLRESKKYGLVW